METGIKYAYIALRISSDTHYAIMMVSTWVLDIQYMASLPVSVCYSGSQFV